MKDLLELIVVPFFVSSAIMIAIAVFAHYAIAL
jgi:hypothetical protein